MVVCIKCGERLKDWVCFADFLSFARVLLEFSDKDCWNFLNFFSKFAFFCGTRCQKTALKTMGYLKDIKSTEWLLQGVSNISNFSFEPRSVHHLYIMPFGVYGNWTLFTMCSLSLNNNLVVVCYLIV